ncbi:unnamed protein product [Ostreobium quekettii]|uniref:NADH:ubiquinone reductase (non-electrogenic) n=1 Tax=Ostreobium quekettii TaxID=121088 RepID=A0A8S1J801_9CHLO|nr:unnamed protein product [Ostreobium quekettii]
MACSALTVRFPGGRRRRAVFKRNESVVKGLGKAGLLPAGVGMGLVATGTAGRGGGMAGRSGGGCGAACSPVCSAGVAHRKGSKQDVDWGKLIGFAVAAWPSLSFRRDEQPLISYDTERPAPVESKRPPGPKPRVVVLGSGWGAVSFIKALSHEACENYDFILVSPRNYFLYTPLLPAVATGTLEERSIVEPIRNIVRGKARYIEAMCSSINPEKRVVVACYPDDAGNDKACFEISYDTLVFAVGAQNNTFGVEGVKEHCFFFKTVEDAHRLRRHVSVCFERASLPQTTEEERRRLLSFVIVGGGPTGVEVAAELHDVINEDLSRMYPDLVPAASIRIVDGNDYVLSAYDRRISHYTGAELRREGVELVMNSRVKAIGPGAVTISRSGETEELEYGTCVWAAGIAKNPLVGQLQEVLPEQGHPRSIVTDGHLGVKGSSGRIFAVGDAATIEQGQALGHADELFARAAKGDNGWLTIKQLRNVLSEASTEFPQFKSYERLFKCYGCQMREKCPMSPVADRTFSSVLAPVEEVAGEGARRNAISREEFNAVLHKIDSQLRPLPATAQVARQEGEYLARLFNTGSMTPGEDLSERIKAFRYAHKGQLAYVGEDKAVIDAPGLGPLWGIAAGLVWKGFETYSQISMRNKILVGFDWVKSKVFGRDVSRV